VINESLIKIRFEKSAKTYLDNAVVQRKMAEKLISFLKNYGQNSFQRVLEIGVGTALFTKMLMENFSVQELYLNDIVNYFEHEKLPDGRFFIHGNGENILIFPDNCDMIVSNASIQWFEEPVKFLNSVGSKIADNGILAFSTFGVENFKEIKAVTGKSLKYLSFAEIYENLSLSFEILGAEESFEILYFKTVRDVLKHIKFTGVNAISREVWGREKLNTFSKEYAKYFEIDGQLSLTYNPYYFICRKK